MKANDAHIRMRLFKIGQTVFGTAERDGMTPFQQSFAELMHRNADAVNIWKEKIRENDDIHSVALFRQPIRNAIKTLQTGKFGGQVLFQGE